ncbi:zinc finger BED domain-containing protein 6-like [Hyposmocoma kahamanoa]|uniref:zinc finger BED domain-containing protein 6-like n=1 Tax=Hyposmocoma kahamanoa TaxID=1477025 RepID=UPI000E6D9C47|nr:zinc finger BED domain-containing protein 6-like [Hyposmocoma kahamanoa]
MAPKKTSSVWKFFNKIDDKSSKCKLCLKIIRSAGNTTNLMGHIRNIHKSSYLEIVPKPKSGILEKGHSKTKETSASDNDSDLCKPSTSSVVKCAETSSQDSSKDCAETRNIDTEQESQMILPLKRQKTITASFTEIDVFSPSGDKTRKINNCILYMICKDHQPFSIVENEGFHNLMKVVAPHYKIPSRTSITRWLDQKFEALSTNFKTKLSTIEYITLTTDIWSDTMNMKSFLGVTAHFGFDIELYAVTLGVYELNQRHTSDYIAAELIKTCEAWGIHKEKVSAVVTDNAANMVKAVELAFGKKKTYSLSPVARLNENPLEVWKDIKIQFPKLYKIAFKFLTMVGTSVPSERLFSKAAQRGLNPFIGFTYKGVRMKTAHGRRILGLAASPLSLNTAFEPSKIKMEYPVAA